MTIEEAVALLAKTHDKGFIVPYEKQKEAIKLGIEALKAVIAHREDFRSGDIYDLPGETKE